MELFDFNETVRRYTFERTELERHASYVIGSVYVCQAFETGIINTYVALSMNKLQLKLKQQISVHCKKSIVIFGKGWLRNTCNYCGVILCDFQ